MPSKKKRPNYKVSKKVVSQGKGNGKKVIPRR